MSLQHGEYRRHDRTDIRTSVSVEIQENELDTNTIDVSETGMSFNKPSQLNLAVGQSVNVTFKRMPHLSVPAKVVRTGNNSIGLEFDHFRFNEADISSIIDSAPWYAKRVSRIKRALWKTFRRYSIFLANTVFRKVLLKAIKPTFIFAVYGNKKDVGTYITPNMSKFIPPILLAGVIKNKHHKGIMVASKFYEHELAQDSDKVNLYLSQLQEEFPHIQKVALVGRLPNFVMKAGNEIKPPYVDGSTGTRFMIWDVGRQMRTLPNYINETTICVLGGAGRIGNMVCEDLTREYSTVIAFDQRYEKDEKVYTPNGAILRTSDTQKLNNSKLFISLTHHGDVITEFMTFIPEGSLVADDTHPCISQKVREHLQALGIQVRKIVLTHEDFTMWPRMPAWSNRAIPGCLVEALVLLEQHETVVSSFDTFRESAEAMGFRGQLIEPLNE